MSGNGIFSFGTTDAERSASRWLFLIGLGSQTQINVGGYTAISEFFLVICLPIAILRNYSIFKKDRCSTMLWLLILWMIGVCVTDIATNNFFAAFIRGFIAPLGILASLVVIYPLLKRNRDGLKWFLLGVAISSVVSIYIFQAGSIVGASDVLSGNMSASEARVGYKLFWVEQMSTWLGLPVKGWYLNFPIAGSVAICFFVSAYSLLTGGRSAFIMSFLSSLLLLFCGHSRSKMKGLAKHGVIVIVGLLILTPLIRLVYKEAAISGFMEEGEFDKYEKQAKGKTVIEILMSGRGEFFIAMSAILDKPILGHGSYARDDKGYTLNYFIEHGADYETINRIQAYESLIGARTIPAHSHIACFWMWAGIPGLLPWLYILYLLYMTLLKRSYVYPPYFGYLAMSIPPMLWAIFFSPFGSRINMGFLIAVCLVIQTMERQQKGMLTTYAGK